MRDRHVNEVVLAGSVGGHLELLEALAPALGDRSRQWVTTDGARSRALSDAGERVHWVPALDQSDFSVRRLFKSVVLAVRLRPKVIISSGAGTVALFCLVGRMLGAEVLWVETMARVRQPSATGRIVSRFASRVLVQWPELSAHYKTATVCSPILLTSEAPAFEEHDDETGTFVSVGSRREPFTRLLSAVARAADDGILPTPVLAQVGPGQVGAEGVVEHETLTPAEFATAVRSNRVVICHGGAGVISSVLCNGRIPIVMARTSKLGEHVDDHQDDLIDKLSSLGLLVEVDGEITQEALERALSSDVSLESTFGNLPAVHEQVSEWLESLSA